jgi:hypothetical protein
MVTWYIGMSGAADGRWDLGLRILGTVAFGHLSGIVATMLPLPRPASAAVESRAALKEAVSLTRRLLLALLVVMEDNKFHSVARARHLGARLRHHVQRLVEIRDAVQAERHLLLLGAFGYEDHDSLVMLMQCQELYLEGMLASLEQREGQEILPEQLVIMKRLRKPLHMLLDAIDKTMSGVTHDEASLRGYTLFSFRIHTHILKFTTKHK